MSQPMSWRNARHGGKKVPRGESANTEGKEKDRVSGALDPVLGRKV